MQNMPNPFNPVTTIRYQVPKVDGLSRVTVRLAVYNILGEQVRQLLAENVLPGYHSILWDGKNMYGKEVATGLYIYQIQATFKNEKKKVNFIKARKMMVIK